MTSVVVDLADLETIVFTTGAIKAIEVALATRKSDPFVRPHLEYTAAHDRLAEAMRNARRADADTVVKWDEPLTDEEFNDLRDVEGVPGGVRFVPITSKSRYDRLSAKGCIVLGQYVEGILWAGASGPELQVDPKGYAARITPRGREKLAMAIVVRQMEKQKTGLAK